MAGAMMALLPARGGDRPHAALVREGPGGEREVRARRLSALALGCALILAVAGPPRPRRRPPRSRRASRWRRLWPENSLLAFRNAVALGADYLELDVHLYQPTARWSSSTIPTLDRTTTGTGPVKARTPAELRGASPQGPQPAPSPARGCPRSTRWWPLAAAGGRRLLLEIKVDAGRRAIPASRSASSPSWTGTAWPPRPWSWPSRRRRGGACARSGPTSARARSTRPATLGPAPAVSRALAEARRGRRRLMGLAHSLVTPEAVPRRGRRVSCSAPGR